MSDQATPVITPQDTKPKKQPPYAVVLMNDDEHTFDYVIDVLCTVFRKKLEDAVILTNDIHTHGKRQVWVGTKELAELKVQQVKGFGNDIYAQQPVTFPIGCYMIPLPN